MINEPWAFLTCFFAAIEVSRLLLIVWYAWTWNKEVPSELVVVE